MTTVRQSNKISTVDLREGDFPSSGATSKLLIGCLAATDLRVGLITQSLRTGYIMSPEHSKRCYYIKLLYESISAIFCAVSVFNLTAISVDRLLALILGLRYSQGVTLRRVWFLVVTVWRFSTIILFLAFNNFNIGINIAQIVLLSLCIGTSTFCYMKIFLTLRYHQTQAQCQVHQGLNGGGIPLNITRCRKTVPSAL